jgi:hypothetical protein
MKPFLVIMFSFFLSAACAQVRLEKEPCELFLRWNGEVELTASTTEKEFSADTSNVLLVNFIKEAGFDRVIIIRDKGWKSANETRADVVRYGGLNELLTGSGIKVVEVRNATSRGLPPTNQSATPSPPIKIDLGLPANAPQ